MYKALGQAAEGVVVTSTKFMTGHLLGGAGAIESVAAILALREQVAPPTINLDDLDDDVPLDVATEPRPLSKWGSEPMAVLNNAFGFGGHNVRNHRREGRKWGIFTHTPRRQPSAAERREPAFATAGSFACPVSEHHLQGSRTRNKKTERNAGAGNREFPPLLRGKAISNAR